MFRSLLSLIGLVLVLCGSVSLSGVSGDGYFDPEIYCTVSYRPGGTCSDVVITPHHAACNGGSPPCTFQFDVSWNETCVNAEFRVDVYHDNSNIYSHVTSGSTGQSGSDQDFFEGSEGDEFELVVQTFDGQFDDPLGTCGTMSASLVLIP